MICQLGEEICPGKLIGEHLAIIVKSAAVTNDVTNDVTNLAAFLEPSRVRGLVGPKVCHCQQSTPAISQSTNSGLPRVGQC